MSPRLAMIQGPAVASLAPDAVHRNCLFAARGLSCYGPYDLAQAYNFPAGLDGSGQTIVIVDAYGSATINQDLAIFDRYFGIPSPPSFTIVDVPGTGVTGSGGLTSWQVETSLDVEYAHAMAPGAKIVLAVAATDNNFDLNAAEAAVFPQYPGAIISQSFGDWETDATAGSSFAQEHEIFKAANAMGDTILAAAGDFGATWTQAVGTTSPVLASYPASDPLVTSVGGTQGNPYPAGLVSNGAYGGEQVWNEPAFDAATGGAPSVLFRAPSWQRGDTGSKARTIPDVAYNAAIDGGVEVIASPYIWLVGGTSCGSPQWAAIVALANQARNAAGHGNLGFANRTLYRLGEQQMKSNGKGAVVYHDITAGNNALDSTLGFAAAPGYDLATGWGTPNVANLVDALAGSSSDRSADSATPANNGGSSSGNKSRAAGTMAPNV